MKRTTIVLSALTTVLLSSMVSTVFAYDGWGDPLSTFRGALNWLWENVIKPIFDFLGNIFSGVAEALAAPFVALADVWRSWASYIFSFGWYGPIVGILVVAACIIVVALLWKFSAYIL